MKVVVTGGGTGGHIYPALAVVEALKRRERDVEVGYIGSREGMEAEIVPRSGLPFYGLTARKLRKLVSPGTIAVLLSLARGYREAADYLRRFRPSVVVGTGGYVAAATVLAAARQRIPTVILGPDAVPGRTNRLIARWASRICVWYAETLAAFPGEKTVRTGVPLREGIVSTHPVWEARSALGLEGDRFTVLVMGGSQGAQRLNEIVIEAIRFLPENVQVLHQTGAKNYETVVEAAKKRGLSSANHLARPYLEREEIPLAYRAADIIVCRCGIVTLAEVTANGLPALLVPLPTAYADHQTKNARPIAQAGGGVLLRQDTLTPERLAQEITGLRNDPARRERMAAASRSLGIPDAANRVAEIAQQLVNR